MTEDRWEELLDMVRTTFEVEDYGRDENDELGGTEIEYIVFNGPMGKLKLEFSTHPAIVDTKTTYKKRIGAEVGVENMYSSTDRSTHLEVWKWNADDEAWQPFSAEAFS